MDDVVKVVILAIVQGIAEFLPISSSGHLAVLSKLFGFQDDENVLMSIALHAGTLLSIILYYHKDLLSMLQPKNFKLALLIGLGTIPAVIVGLGLKDMMDQFVNTPLFIAGFFCCTAAILFFLHNREPIGKPLKEIGPRDALAIGVLQAIAILPGISRSGSTIAIATRLGYDHEDAARFSFLLGIPAIGGAVVLYLKDILEMGANESGGSVTLPLLFLGFVVSFVTGYGALLCLIKILRKGKLHHFAIYLVCIAIILAGFTFFWS